MRQFLSKPNLLFLSYSSGFFLGWIAWLSRAEMLLAGFHNIIQVCSMLSLAFCACLLWLKMKPQIPRLPMTNYKVVGVVCLIVYMFLTASPILFQYTSRFLGPVVRDIVLFLFLLSGPALGFFTKKQKIIFSLVFGLFILVGIITIGRINLGVVTMAENRGQAFEEVGVRLLYSYQVGIGATSAYLLLYFVGTLKNIIPSLICSAGVVLWVYSSLIYSKRQGIAEFLVVFAVFTLLLFFGEKLKRYRFAMIPVVCAVVVGAGVFAFQTSAFDVMLDRVFGRFIEISDRGLGNFDRLEESLYYLESEEMFRILIGQGMGGFSFSAIAMHSLHMGWMNLVFKGGFLLPMFYVSVLFWNIFYVLKTRNFPNKLLALFFPAFCMVHLIYSPLWGLVPTVFWIGLAFFSPEIFLISARNEQEQRHRHRPPPRVFER